MHHRPFGATNEPNACRWCGRPVRRWHVVTWEFTGKPPLICERQPGWERCHSTEFVPVADDPLAFQCCGCGHVRRPRKMVARAPGEPKTGFFCTASCTVQFARAVLEAGFKLERREESTSSSCLERTSPEQNG